MSGSLELLQERLRRDHISVDDVWLSECIEHFVSVEPAISTPDLYERTLEQWSLSDLADIGIANLPVQVNDERASLLAGKYAVQMLFVVDISRSASDQLRALYDQQIDQTDGEKLESKAVNASKKKRTLKLQLTDGHQTVSAIEISPIACLNTKLAPGCKLLLSGPLRCVNRVLLLEPQHVRVLGGEVAKYEIENAFENVLLRQLGRPLNPEPRTDYKEPAIVEATPRDVQHLDVLHEQYRQHKTESQAVADLDFSEDMFDDDEMLAQVNLDVAIPAIKKSPALHQDAVIDLAEDDDFKDIPMAVMATYHTESYNLNSDDDADFADVTMENTSRRSAAETTATTAARLIDDDDDAFASVAFDEELLQKERTALTPPEPPTPPSIRDANYPFKVQRCNLVTIDQLLQPVRPINAQSPPSPFMLKAEVVSVFEKLSIRPDSWRIGVLLRDSHSQGQLRVRLVDAPLDYLSGFTLPEVNEMRRISSERPQVLEQIAEVLAGLKRKLETLHCYWKLPAAAEADGVWLVTRLVEETPVLDRMLGQKIAAERIRKV